MGWLVHQGWGAPEDIFLDIDPSRGISAGERWLHCLEDAATRCEAVLFLVSEAWLQSKWCFDEYQLANKLNKRLFACLLEDIAFDRLPGGLGNEWQIVKLYGEPSQRFVPTTTENKPDAPVYFNEAGLVRLSQGLRKAGIGASTFELKPDAASAFGWRHPYRGLEALDIDDAAVLFGRDADLVRGIDKLRGLRARGQSRILSIVGASGAGKSSFLRAGLWPRLNRDDASWLPLLPIRAGRNGAIEGEEGLLSRLEEAFARVGQRASRAALRKRLASREDFASALEELASLGAKRALTNLAPLIVLPFDQAEEVTSVDNLDQTKLFLQLVRSGLESDLLFLLTSIRSDAFGALQSLPALGGFHQETLSLLPVPPGEMGPIIREPALVLRRKVGTRAPVLSVQAVEILQREVDGEADALPLLAFALERLMREHLGNETIDLPELSQTGGVASAIGAAAELAISDSGMRDLASRVEILRTIFIPTLARVDPATLNAHRRPASRSEFPSDLLHVVDAFIARRLLVAKGSGAEATIEIAHEALLRLWPDLVKLLDEEREALVALENILHAARAWDAADTTQKDEFLVHRGTRLAFTEALSARSPSWQSKFDPAAVYMGACRAREVAERETLQHVGEGIAVFSKDEALVEYNRAFTIMWSLEPAFLDGGPSFGEWLDHLKEQRRLPAVANYGHWRRHERAHFNKSGELPQDLWVLPDGRTLRLARQRHSGGGLLIVFSDITNEVALRGSYDALLQTQKATLDKLHEAVVVFGLDGRLKLFNAAFQSLWRLEADQLEPEMPFDRLVELFQPLFHDKATWAQVRTRITDASPEARTEYRAEMRRNDETVLKFLTRPLPDGATLVAFQDITADRRVEEALRERAEAFEQADKLKGTFVENVSYQLRSPLQAIFGNAELLRHRVFGPLNDRQLEQMDSVLDAAANLSRLIDNILDAAMVEAGSVQLDLSPVNIYETIRDSVQMAASKARDVEVPINVECDPAIGDIEADQKRIIQVIVNLLSNALRHTERGDTITVSAERLDGIVRVVVADTGKGMGLDQQARAFESFESGDRRGAGLGLALVRSFVEMHGGWVLLQSEPGRGVTVTCNFPAHHPKRES